MKKGLSILLIILIFLSVPSVYLKVKTENSQKTAELAIDYVSVLDLSKQLKKEGKTIDDVLSSLKDDGVNSIVLPNNNFSLLEYRGIVSVLSGAEMNQMSLLSKTNRTFSNSSSYMFVLNKSYANEVESILKNRFSKIHVTETEFNNQKMYGIDMDEESFLTASIPFLNEDFSLLTSNPYNFHVIPKVDNQWDGHESLVISQLNQWNKTSYLSKILYADSGVLGYPFDIKRYVTKMPKVPIAYTEFFIATQKQKGINTVATLIHNNVVRLHSIPDADFSVGIDKPGVIENRISLAVKERDIRIIDIHLPSNSVEYHSNTLFNKSLTLIKRSEDELKKDGFHLGIAKTFDWNSNIFYTLSRWISFFAGVTLISFVLSFYYRKLSLLTLIVGYFSIIVSKILLTSLIWKGIALATAIFIPLLSISLLLNWLKKEDKPLSILKTFIYFWKMSVVTILAVVPLIGMHSDVKYLLYLDQFRGVSLVSLLPPVITIFILIVFYKMLSLSNALTFLKAPIRIWQVIAIGMIGIAGLYYLSRTGNGGTTLPFELQFRAFLDHAMGIRPRTKEFLIGHPLMILTIYYWKRWKYCKWLLPFAVIGQLSMIDTFCHLHTPSLISLVRDIYGVALGSVISYIVLMIVIFAVSYFKRLFIRFKQSNQSDMTKTTV